MKKKYPKYSVLMSVYNKENPKWFDESIQSMLNQTVLCDEFVIVEDGPLTKKLYEVIEKFTKEYPKLFKIVKIEKNGGLGPALQIGVENCKNEWIARMDSDDYSFPERIEKQLNYIIKNKDVSLVGSWHNEFIGKIDNIQTVKKLPETNEEVVSYSRRRNPFSHPSVMMKKSAVLKAGNYRTYHLVEDYDMWLRMIRTGTKCYNIQESLIAVRVSKDLYKRRGGIKYLKSILKFKKEQYKVGYFTFKDYIISSTSSAIVCLMPGWLRQFVYEKMLRK